MKRLLALLLLVLAFSALAQPERPAWHSIELTNALTGEVFSLAGFEGSSVYVETMATWCSNCRRQLNNVKEAKAQLSEDDNVVFVMISVEGNLADERLAAYAEREDFDFVFAVATPELLSGLVDTFGRRVTSPPSTPHFVINADGSSSELSTGMEAADGILAFIGVEPGN